MTQAEATRLDGRVVMALLVGATRAERFCDGAFAEFVDTGCVSCWLQRLQELDVGKLESR